MTLKASVLDMYFYICFNLYYNQLRVALYTSSAQVYHDIDIGNLFVRMCEQSVALAIRIN